MLNYVEGSEKEVAEYNNDGYVQGGPDRIIKY